ncbi:MAG: ParB/RepB/Spo0J family partition protein [Desulfobulbaceae bacterium]|jgi:ParB family chromosome partitioning protein|nr:ParB/RepB/Spo0J family partition protein [Desulfobulbaceae bacterium]
MSLGKGLGALMTDGADDFSAEGEYILCDINAIGPNPYQPRKEMDNAALQDLSASIRQKGILQPLVVVVDDDDMDRYVLIAGERRLRASKLAGLEEVPVIVRNVSVQDRLELALIENIQRENLNVIEEAMAYAQLIGEFGLTQEEVAKQVGKKRSTVANTLRLLQLPEFAKDDVVNGRLSMGHARVLLSLKTEEEMQILRDTIIQKRLTVRQAEGLAKGVQKKVRATRSKEQGISIPLSYCKTLSNDIVRTFDTTAKIVQNGSRGKIEIEYYSLDDLERIHGLMSKISGS